MRAVAQRVSAARVLVESEVVGAVDHGLLVLLGVGRDDTEADAVALGRKLAGLRVFADPAGKMNLSVSDVRGSILLVSQFTLLGDVRKGRRPSFVAAADPDHAVAMLDVVAATLAEESIPVESGRFGAHMAVELVNDGPVTIVVDTDAGSIA
jgi:D-tyrosyl-tRNA(Tyr) deacylase